MAYDRYITYIQHKPAWATTFHESVRRLEDFRRQLIGSGVFSPHLIPVSWFPTATGFPRATFFFIIRKKGAGSGIPGRKRGTGIENLSFFCVVYEARPAYTWRWLLLLLLLPYMSHISGLLRGWVRVRMLDACFRYHTAAWTGTGAELTALWRRLWRSDGVHRGARHKYP